MVSVALSLMVLLIKEIMNILLFPSCCSFFLTPVSNILMWKFVHILYSYFVVSNIEVSSCFLNIVMVFVDCHEWFYIKKKL
jgi:hypothetical protein